ncbi:MAG: M61 family metallopeptidase [Planctomycetota bacterium]|jgi:predicted metalloprotease with PDZ domain
MQRIRFSLLLLLTSLPVLAQDRVAFEFIFNPEMARPRIEARFTGLEQEKLTVAMPAWRPGSYSIRDFGKALRNFSAFDSDRQPLPSRKESTNIWSIDCAGKDEVIVSYELALSEENYTGRTRRQEDQDGQRWMSCRAYLFQGPMTWLHVPGRIDCPQELSFSIPDSWQVATGLEWDEDSTSYGAQDYDVFADSPFHVGEFESLSFEYQDVDYEIALSGFERDKSNREQIVRRYSKIVAEQIEMMGPAPFDKYAFLIRRPSRPGGSGLEHLNSTNISMMELSGSTESRNSIWDSIVSHEFFHLWNVKRLRPLALGPFDYSQPNRTRYLWLCEGVTSYYGDLLLVRSGVWNEESYWTESISNEINTLQRNPGRLKMSVAEASWTIWDGRAGRRAPDYYNKGQLLGLLLDIEIRVASENRHSLDDVMRALYQQCMASGQGFADGDVRRICEELGGRSFGEFFASYVEGTEELPFTETLAKIGISASPRMIRQDDGSERPGRWRVDYIKDASETALAMRRAMTN